jgi:hypothetical protein
MPALPSGTDRPEVELRRQRIALHVVFWLLWASCGVALFWHLTHERYDLAPVETLAVVVSAIGIQLTSKPAQPTHDDTEVPHGS